jgi:ribosomal protein L20A (L18A)
VSNQQKYITITHYKEREFYFLNYAIQTKDGFISKEIEQFHESDKEKFIERIKALQTEFPNNQVVSISLVANQSIHQEHDRNRATAEIFPHNFVIQDKIDVGTIPTTLYFSPFAILYQQYKDGLSDELKLLIGYFDRKLFMMFATSDKIHQSWTIGTRGLTEKQIAERVYKSMQAYYKISYNFADHLDMLVSDESPKLLKVLREELSLHIELTQNSIHNLLHDMASSDEKAKNSYIKTLKKIESIREIEESKKGDNQDKFERKQVLDEKLDDIKLVNDEKKGLLETVKGMFSSSPSEGSFMTRSLTSTLPILAVFAMGGFFHLQNEEISNKLSIKDSQIMAQHTNLKLAKISDNVFLAMGKNAELKKATLSTQKVDIKGIVWGIEPLKNSLNEVYANGKFDIKPLENFMTEFTFKSK